MQRKTLRLKEFDYTSEGFYFVTMCTQGRKHVFGSVKNGIVDLNSYGQIVLDCWNEIPNHFLNVQLVEFIVMPNHVHGIITIESNVGATHASPLPTKLIRPFPHGPIPKSLGAIIGSFKSSVSKRINQLCRTSGSIWQRNYYERVIRHENELNQIRQYILDNPIKWDEDPENKLNISKNSMVRARRAVPQLT